MWGLQAQMGIPEGPISRAAANRVRQNIRSGLVGIPAQEVRNFS